MGFYPDKVGERFSAPKRAGKAARANAVGTGAAFTCGSFVRFYLEIDAETKLIREIRYQTDGCGFAIAAAEVIAEKIDGQKLTDLHGLNKSEFFNTIERELGAFSPARKHCAEICFDALQAALNDFRAFQLEEFAGEKALICTCFGVSEETIERLIAAGAADSVEAVGDVSHAGTGCGSCRFLIQELIDLHGLEN
jgi:NifU-like protein